MLKCQQIREVCKGHLPIDVVRTLETLAEQDRMLNEKILRIAMQSDQMIQTLESLIGVMDNFKSTVESVRKVDGDESVQSEALVPDGDAHR